MKNMRYDNDLHPGITMHKIPVKAGFAGLLFTIGVMLACFMGIPATIYFFVLAILLGIAVAVMLRFIPRQAGFVVLALTLVMIVCLAGIPSIDWPEKLNEHMLLSAIVAPPPPPQGSLSAYRCDCGQRQSKQPVDSKPRRIKATRSEGRAQSALDGTWEGKMNDLPGVSLIVADAGGGDLGGVVTFYFQMRDNERSPWRVAGKAVAPLLAAHPEGTALVFEVQHHRKHGSPDFGPNVVFRMELAGDNQALLYNLGDNSTGPIKLTRQD